MLQDEGLIASAKDIAVIAARAAWPEYQQFHAYVCQPERSFQLISRIAFYADAAIQPLVPKIIEVHDQVEFAAQRYRGALGDLVNALLGVKARQEGKYYKVFLLSAPDSPDTLKLRDRVPNDLRAKSGRTAAYVQGQRYVSTDALVKAVKTSDLVEAFD
jgi:hypothetical protein